MPQLTRDCISLRAHEPRVPYLAVMVTVLVPTGIPDDFVEELPPQPLAISPVPNNRRTRPSTFGRHLQAGSPSLQPPQSLWIGPFRLQIERARRRFRFAQASPPLGWEHINLTGNYPWKSRTTPALTCASQPLRTSTHPERVNCPLADGR